MLLSIVLIYYEVSMEFFKNNITIITMNNTYPHNFFSVNSFIIQ
nr:MAG TPA: hypothetical protein [Crassvirales sp.]